MPISIVSAPTKAIQSTNNDSSLSAANSTEDSDSAPKDFLALLLNLGQQALPTTLSDEAKDITSTDDTALPAETMADNAASDLLTTLGFIPIESRDTTAKTSSSGGETDTALDATSSTFGYSNSTVSTIEQNALPANISLQAAQANDLAQTTNFFGKPDEAAIIADEPTTGQTVNNDIGSALPLIQQSNTSAQKETSNTAEIGIHAAVKSANWHQDFNQKIVWMASNDTQSARITLNPEQMGPIEVSLNVDKGNATATFVSSNPDVRESIETALPRLREMFAGIGIELGQANVSSESFKQPASDYDGSTNRSQEDGSNGILSVSTNQTASAGAYTTRLGDGLVDIFA